MIGNEWGPGESGFIIVPGLGSISEQEATVTHAMTQMGTAATCDNCLPINTRNLFSQHPGNKIAQTLCGLRRFEAL